MGKPAGCGACAFRAVWAFRRSVRVRIAVTFGASPCVFIPYLKYT